MTIRYKQWLDKVSSGEFDVKNVNMNVRLVCEDYEPNENDTPGSVTPYILNGVSVLVEDYFCTNTMSSILDTIKDKMELGFALFPDVISQQIELKIADPVKKEKLKQLVRMPPQEGNNFQFWMDLKENGIKWFVLESAEHDCLTFCEIL